MARERGSGHNCANGLLCQWVIMLSAWRWNAAQRVTFPCCSARDVRTGVGVTWRGDLVAGIWVPHFSMSHFQTAGQTAHSVSKLATWPCQTNERNKKSATYKIQKSCRFKEDVWAAVQQAWCFVLTSRLNRESREFTRSSRCGFVAQWLERATRFRKILGSIPGGAALCFFRLIRLSVLLSLSELKEKSWLGLMLHFKVRNTNNYYCLLNMSFGEELL